MATTYTTGDLARASGNTLRTVRYYDELGLLGDHCRSAGGHRLFTALHLQRLNTITALRAVGLSLKEVQMLGELRDRTAEASPVILEGARTLVDDKLKAVREQLQTLCRVERELSEMQATLDNCQDCEGVRQPKRCGSCARITELDPNHLAAVLLTPSDGAGDCGAA